MIGARGVQPTEFERLALFGIPSAAVLGFTLQPVVAIADPIALLITGVLTAMLLVVFVRSFVVGQMSDRDEEVAGLIVVAAFISVLITVGSAWWEHRKADAICAQLQRVMLFEHRVRKDVPEIFRSLGCKIQT